jgi:cytochrome c oxidase subunit 3
MSAGDVKHDYHLVNPSPWPLIGSIAAFTMAIGLVVWMNKDASDYGGLFGLAGSPWILILGALLVGYTFVGWWRDVIKESVVTHEHSPVVKLGLRYGMILFIASEVMFFVAWFWAYFAVAFFPTDHGLAAWPPHGIQTFDPWHLPLVGTLVLLTSGTTITWAHHAIQTEDRQGAIWGLGITILLGMLFTALQAYEYIHAAFFFGTSGDVREPAAALSIVAGSPDATVEPVIYGSTFFMATGFHGFHVIVGTIFLIVMFGRLLRGHFTPERHFGFEAAAWYWHFVDVVWLFLFASIYVWGAGPHPGGHG